MAATNGTLPEYVKRTQRSYYWRHRDAILARLKKARKRAKSRRPNNKALRATVKVRVPTPYSPPTTPVTREDWNDD